MKLKIFLMSVFVMLSASAQTHRLYVGTYTNACESKGIYTFQFDTQTGDATLVSATEDVINPSYLALADDMLYTVNENGSESSLSAFQVKDGKLTLTDVQPTAGADPCYLSVTPKHVITANYSGGSISVFERNPDGKHVRNDLITHSGRSVNDERQEAPHPHMVLFSPTGELFVPDLGTDKIFVYTYDATGEKPLTRIDEISVKKGSGPRHLRFANPNRFYLLHELDGTLSTYEKVGGKWKLKAENSVVSKENKEISAAHIEISPDGKFLYATNRGDANTISVFAIKKDGKLKPVETVSTKGKGPRNFTFSPDGKMLLVAHQNSNDIIIFKRDLKTGKLADSGKRIELCSPVCLLFE